MYASCYISLDYDLRVIHIREGRSDVDITLDTDELGIWLIEDAEDGPKQLGHIPWREVARGVQQAMLQEKFLIALINLDQEEGL